MFRNGNNGWGAGKTALRMAAKTLWHVPGSFGIARALGPHYSLRCVVFHHVSDVESPFTKGLGVTTSRTEFEAALKFLTRHYTPVSLEDILTESALRELPTRPVLVTFDDAYATVAEFAAPLCREFGVPAVFFINAAYLDNRRLALDNLTCYICNQLGMQAINRAVRAVSRLSFPEFRSPTDVSSYFQPAISLSEKNAFFELLLRFVGRDGGELAAEAGLYLTSQQVRELAKLDIEIGNHTYSHVHCRSLSGDGFFVEIETNKAVLEAIAGTKVRSFSVPYGSSADLTVELLERLQRSGHQAAFLAESCANPALADRYCIDRVAVEGCSEDVLFAEIEILPRFRIIRKWLFGSLYPDFFRKARGVRELNAVP